MTRDDALRVLSLTEPFSAAQLRLAYRRAAFHAHPDRGGELAEMKRVNEAYDVLRGGPKRAEPAPEERGGRRKRKPPKPRYDDWGPADSWWPPRKPPPRDGGSRPEDYTGQLFICTRCRSVYRGETLAAVCGCGGSVRRY